MKRYIYPLILMALIGSGASSALADESGRHMQADKILIEKSDRRMTLFKSGKVIKTYKVSLGSHPQGAKTRQGDGKTPEGKYSISGRRQNSQFHRALRVSYPDAADREQARRLGVDPGGDIMIHGLPAYLGFLGGLHPSMTGRKAVSR